VGRIEKSFQTVWKPGDRPLIKGLPTDEEIEKIKAIIPVYLNALKTRVLTREVVREAYRYVTGKGISDIARCLLHTLLEEELKTTPRLRTGRNRHD
jgi:hypothetical protein